MAPFIDARQRVIGRRAGGGGVERSPRRLTTEMSPFLCSAEVDAREKEYSYSRGMWGRVVNEGGNDADKAGKMNGCH